eukprot:gene14728-16262_t
MKKAKSNQSSGTFRTKEVVLLPNALDDEVFRGRRKALLMQNGFIPSELKVEKSWTAEEVSNLFETVFEQQLHRSSAEGDNNRMRLSFLGGIGKTLQEPLLQQGQEIDGACLSRVFAQKVIWLRPSRDIPMNDEPTDSHVPSYDLPATMLPLINEIPSSHVHNLLNTPHNINHMQEIVPECPRNIIEDTLITSIDLDDAIDTLMQWNTDKQAVETTCKLPLETPRQVVDKYKEDNLIERERSTALHVPRENIWKDALTFYKSNMGNKEKLLRKLMFVCFHDEDGIDVGYKNGYLLNGTSGDILLEDIPVTRATGCLINFIKSLQQCETKEAINELFDTSDGPAFEQIISSSDWDPQEDVTVGNKNILIDMLLHEETINRRGRTVVAMREGLFFMQFGKCLDLAVSKLLFLGIKDIIDNGDFLSVLEFDDADSDKKLAVRAWFERLVQKRLKNYW